MSAKPTSSVVCVQQCCVVFSTGISTEMDPRDYQDFVDYLASPEDSRKWPNRFDDFDSKEKNQAKRSNSKTKLGVYYL